MAVSSRRTGLLIEPQKQLKIGVTFLLLNLVFSILIGGILIYFLWDIYESISVYFKLTNQENAITVAKLTKPLSAVAGLVVLFIALTLYISTKYTHAFYGPLVAINRFLDNLLAGRPPEPLKIRASDQLKELAEKLNILSDKLADSQKRNTP